MQEPITEIAEEDINPIDNVEDILNSHNWNFDRPSEDELVLTVSGKHSKYRLFFIWQEHMNALQFACHFDLTVSNDNTAEAQSAILAINEKLWLGHFNLPASTMSPTFRYTSFFHGANKAAASETIEEVVDLALLQCEKHYPVFQLLTDQTMALDTNTMSLALMETQGES